MNWERIRTIVKKELRQVLRDPRMRSMMILPPIIQLTVFGFAVNLDVEHAAIAWVDGDHSPASRDLGATLANSRYFTVKAEPASEADAAQLLDAGKVLGVVRVLPGFDSDLRRGQTAQVQILMDGANSNDASIVSAYLRNLLSAFGQRWHAGVSVSPIQVDSRVWFNAELKSRNYFVPGVIMNIITLITLMLTAMAIVREKEMGTMEQLMVTPILPMELMLGKTLPFAAIGLFDMALATITALLVFHIPFRGSVLMLVGSSCLFLLTTLGAGLFISTVSRTQQQALMSSFMFFTPTFMLSGFTFPVQNMPDFVRWLTYLNPLRYFVEILRGVFLKGSGPAVLWPQMLVLGVIGITVLVASAARFRKRLE